MRLTNFLNLSSQTLFVSLSLLSSNTYAASAGDIRVTHCTTSTNSCGNVLVGAARIDFNSIQWVGKDSPGSFGLQSGGQEFGFSGDSKYLTEEAQANQWKFDSTNHLEIFPASHGAAPTMSHFFAPIQVGHTTASHAYTISSPFGSLPVAVEGEGIADEDDPIITLKVEANGTDCKEENCKQLHVAEGTAMTFRVTPQVASNRVPQGVSASYVLVNLVARENYTRCKRDYLSFQDEGLTPNSFVQGDYFHYLERLGPKYTPNSCQRVYSFLASAGKPFEFKATNKRGTGTGNVQYDFYINGHYDPYNPNTAQYVGSWKSIQLTTNPQVVTPPPSTGNGTTDGDKSTGNGETTTTPPSTTSPVQVHFSAIQRADSLMVELTPVISPSLVDGDILWLGIPKNMLDKKVAITFDKAGSQGLDLNWVVTGPNVVTDLENSIKGVGVQAVSVGEPTKQLHHTVWLDSGYYEAKVKLPTSNHAGGMWSLNIKGALETQLNVASNSPVWFPYVDDQPTLSSSTGDLKQTPENQMMTLSGSGFSTTLTYNKPISNFNINGQIANSMGFSKVGFNVNSSQQFDFDLWFGNTWSGGAEKLEFSLCKFDLSKQTWIQVLPVPNKNEGCQ